MSRSTATRYDTGPTVAVGSADLHGAWNDGVFAGDKELVDHARRAAHNAVIVRVFLVTIQARPDTPLGAVAALASYSPGRSIVSQCPDEVAEILSGEVPPPPIEEYPFSWMKEPAHV